MTFLDEHEILEGAINLHLHVGPDYCPRYGTASSWPSRQLRWEFARLA